MTNFIPIFPLGIVVYPNEQLNLHIFEPRYKQLIQECFETQKPFGIPSVIDDKIKEMGTLVRVKEISQVYEDGKMDIKTEGLQVFRMLELINELPEKLYSGAIVNYPENELTGNRIVMTGIIKGIRELHHLLTIEKKFPKPDSELWSYDVAHHAGMSLPEEYELLELMHELQRQEYLKRHLTKVIPVIAEMDMLKQKIKLNGHFKNVKGLDG
ncbi:MAG: LON peptidase substrate-binding domain-containing protein [Chitinophagaceae bacterium]|nr:LON peptidase substrate-binding domain-containing protein [Chitinophagaceae bacterium]